MSILKTALSTSAALIGLALIVTAPASADFVINDDLIVDGSACVGFDCVNGESFGFDTLRLSENNLRIHFKDTSTAASFPTKDWRIVANDSANGGSSYLAFEDTDNARQTFRVFHGARANALVVSSSSRIGIGTATPSVELHVVDGDTPTLRLEQDTSSGFGPQTWDVAGNETNFFIRDVTNGSKLPLRIRPGAPSSSIDINNNGDVGIGTSTPGTDYLAINSKLEIRGSGNFGLGLRTEDAGDTASIMFGQGATAKWVISSRQGFDAPNDALKIFNEAIQAVFTLEQNGNLTLTGNCADAPGGAGCTADYVFEPGYELMELDQLAEFVSENKHLPNVPSADDTRQNGLNLNAMNGRLLEKIEELVLYTLQQQEQLRALRAARDESRALHEEWKSRFEALEGGSR